jgi:hypothetical protein
MMLVAKIRAGVDGFKGLCCRGNKSAGVTDQREKFAVPSAWYSKLSEQGSVDVLP